ncbi:hypothetical protein ACLOJK_025096 [Asimina triloba]
MDPPLTSLNASPLCNGGLLFLTLIVGVLGFLFLIITRFQLVMSKTKLPPGSYGWPVVGETMSIRSRNSKLSDFISKRRKRYHPEVFKTSLFGHKMIYMCGPAANKFLFSNENKLILTWWPHSVQSIFPSAVNNSNTSGHQRKLLASFLKPEALRSYVGMLDAATQRHVKDEWGGRGEVKAAELIRKYAFVLACRLFSSVEDQQLVSKLAHELHHLVRGVLQVPVRLPGTRYHRAMKAAEEIRKELRPIIEQRRKEAAAAAMAGSSVPKMQDMVWYLMTTADDKGRFMTEKEILDNMVLLLFAGHDTTTCAITFLVKFLAHRPDVYEQVYKEQMEIAKSKGEGDHLNWEDILKMKFSWNVACESMRLQPPVGGGFREAISDFTYAGFTIPKGWKISWSPYTTSKSEEYFPEPQKFDPWRFERDSPIPYTFIPFGGGPRMCPGKEFARLEILVFLHNVVKRFKWEAIIPDEEIKLDMMPYLAQGLPLRLQPHPKADK